MINWIFVTQTNHSQTIIIKEKKSHYGDVVSLVLYTGANCPFEFNQVFTLHSAIIKFFSFVFNSVSISIRHYSWQTNEKTKMWTKLNLRRQSNAKKKWNQLANLNQATIQYFFYFPLVSSAIFSQESNKYQTASNESSLCSIWNENEWKFTIYLTINTSFKKKSSLANWNLQNQFRIIISV